MNRSFMPRRAFESHAVSFLLLALLAFFDTTLACGQDVFLKTSQQTGQGMTRKRGAECVVVTARHIAGLNGRIDTVAASERHGQAELQRSWDPDLAILHVTGGSVPCQEDYWTSSADSLLKGATAGQLRLREEDGSRTLLPAQITNVDEEYITIRPASRSDSFRESMSGAGFVVNGRLVGIFLSIVKDEARVFRVDSAERILSSFMRPEADPKLVATAMTALRDLTGDWKVVPWEAQVIRLTRSGSGYKGTMAGQSGANDTIAPVLAHLGQVVFTLDRVRGQLAQDRNPDGQLRQEWSYEYEATLFYYGYESQCAGVPVKGLTATITSHPASGDKFIVFKNLDSYDVRYDSKRKRCDLKLLSGDRELFLSQTH